MFILKNFDLVIEKMLVTLSVIYSLPANEAVINTLRKRKEKSGFKRLFTLNKLT